MIIILLTILFLIPHPVLAGNDLTINCHSSACSKSSDLPLFKEINIYPGFNLSQKITVVNQRSESCSLRFNPINSNNSLLSDAINLSLSSDNQVWYAGTINTLFNKSDHLLGDIPSNSSREYLWTVFLNQSLDNQYQNLLTSFDLNLNFTCADSQTSTCTDSIPAKTPTNFVAIPGQNSVTLSWSEPDDNFTYHLIAYGTDPEKFLYGNPNIGGKNTSSYTVNSLSAGTTYYFKIRTGNGCAPGPFSSIVSAAPLGSVLATSSPPPGFQPEVLGVQYTGTTTGSVAGLSCSKIIPFAFLLALIVNLILHPYPLMILAISLLAFSFDYYLSQFSCQKYPFYVGSILSLLLPLIFSFQKKRKKLY